MLKKITIILSLFLSVSLAQATTIDQLIKSAQAANAKEIQVPDFSLTDLNGTVYTDESTKGKFLVVNFWATWCPPCLKEIPDFVDFYEKNKDKVLILGLDYEQLEQKSVVEFTEGFMVNYPIILFNDKNDSQFTKFGDTIGLPTTYIYDKKGRLIDVHTGQLSINDLQKIILPR